MDYERLRIRKLKAAERIEDFNCGDADLNDFIRSEAGLYSLELLAVTYVVEDDTTGKMLAYFSLANDKVSLSEFDNKTEFNRFRKHRFVNEKRLKSYPAAKICRLGVSESAKGMHIGTYLLDFIKGYFVSDNKTGCRFLTVDAYSAAVPFYLNNRFAPLNNEEGDSATRLLFYDLKTSVQPAVEL